MRKLLTILMCAFVLSTATPALAMASSLDDLTQPQQSTTVDNSTVESSENQSSGSSMTTAEDFSKSLANASDLSGSANDKVVQSVEQNMRKAVGIIVNIMAYGITIFLGLTTILDIAYIAIPMSRTILGNGFAGNPGVGGTPNGMAPGMGGMGMGGMGMGSGMGGYGMHGYGHGRYGMGGGMGMGGMGAGMGGMGAGMAGQQASATGRHQWVSNAALNAVAAEMVTDPTTGRQQSAFKLYAKDMMVKLPCTAVLIVLAVSGVLVKLGFKIGDVACDAIESIGSMF